MKEKSSMILPNDGECAFCAYLRGDRPYTILHRDKYTATLVTREQRGIPHLLVIPLRHIQTIIELHDKEASALIINVRAAAHAIDRAYARPGIAVWQNNGTSAGQAIGHVHFHVAGTLENGGTNWGKVPELPIEETEEIANHLRLFDGGSNPALSR
jgi:histidine triad (HIT) family protein